MYRYIAHKWNSFARIPKFHFYSSHVFLPVCPPSIFSIWLRIRINGNSRVMAYCLLAWLQLCFDSAVCCISIHKRVCVILVCCNSQLAVKFVRILQRRWGLNSSNATWPYCPSTNSTFPSPVNMATADAEYHASELQPAWSKRVWIATHVGMRPKLQC